MTDKTKYIIKIIASTITILAIIGYGIFAFVKFGNYGAQNVCNKIQVKIVDDNDYKFIQPNDIITQLNECNIYPIGETISHKQTNQIEKCVEAMNLVKRAECYKKNNGDVVVSVYQRHPMFLVVNGNNGYYIDTERKKMPTSSKFTAWLPVVSGFVSEKFAKKDLYDFIVYINNDEFWSNHFGQIYINQKQEIELIAKNGVYNIYLGKLSNYQDKLKKLRAWYEQYPEAAWGNKYSRVDLSYEKLIYCIKKNSLMKETYFAAIDLGTNKIAGAVAKKQEDGQLIIISLEEEATEANAVLCGLVSDQQQILFQIKRLITKLQNSSKVTINNCYIGIGGKLFEEKYPKNMQLMNDVINSAKDLRPAINLIEVECPIICTANAVLSDHEKNNGCLLIDFGAGCTSFVLYENGEPIKKNANRLGGDLVTKDITDLQLPFKIAEILKKKFGNALASTETPEKIIELSKKTDNGKVSSIRSGQLAYIIEARVRETVDVLLNYLLSLNWFNKGIEKRSIVITGGASKLTNLDTLISEKTKVSVRIANAGNKIANAKYFPTMQDARYSALCGMLLCATEECKIANEVIVKKKSKKHPFKTVVDKIGQGFDNLFSGKNESFNETQENNTDK